MSICKDGARPALFIGSSSEGLPTALAFRDALASCADVTVWHEGVFGLGDGTLEALVTATERFDFALLVLTPDDLTTSRRRRQQAPRDNVLFECGLFVGALGRHRTFIAYDRRTPVRLPSDLAGVTVAAFGDASTSIELHAQLRPAATAIRSAIARLRTRQPPPHPFWRPFLDDGTRLVLGTFHQFSHFEASGVLAVGDAVCLTVLSSHLHARYRVDLPVAYADRLSGDALAGNVITIGGGDANSVTRDVVTRTRFPLRLGDPGRAEISFRSTATGVYYAPESDVAGAVTRDYGIIVRSANPFDTRAKILSVFGCFGYGTWAAGVAACSEAFLNHLLVASGADLVCVVAADVVRGVPQVPRICEVHELGV